MITRINSCESSKFLAKPESGRSFHKNPESLPLKSERVFSLFVDLKSCIEGSNLKITSTGEELICFICQNILGRGKEKIS
jgi:hypothetical protein